MTILSFSKKNSKKKIFIFHIDLTPLILQNVKNYKENDPAPKQTELMGL